MFDRRFKINESYPASCIDDAVFRGQVADGNTLGMYRRHRFCQMSEHLADLVQVHGDIGAGCATFQPWIPLYQPAAQGVTLQVVLHQKSVLPVPEVSVGLRRHIQGSQKAEQPELLA